MSLWQQLPTKTNSRENWLLVHRSLKWTGATENLPRTPIFAHRKGSLLCYFPRYVLINQKIVPCSPFWRQTPFPSEWRSLLSQRAQTRVCRISSLMSIRNISRGIVTQFWIFRGETWNVSIGKEKLQGEKRSLALLQHKVMVFLHVCLLLRERGPQHCSVSQE